MRIECPFCSSHDVTVKMLTFAQFAVGRCHSCDKSFTIAVSTKVARTRVPKEKAKAVLSEAEQRFDAAVQLWLNAAYEFSFQTFDGHSSDPATAYAEAVSFQKALEAYKER